MRKNKSLGLRKLIWVLSVSTVTILGVYIAYSLPKKPEVFVVNDSEIHFGETKLTGRIQKDTPVGLEGNYFLIIPNQKPILLDVQQDSDHFVGRQASLRGILFPETKSGQPMTMKVITITME